MQKKILVADDESVTRELLALLLTKAGYDVVVAKDGLDAVEKASTEKPDLVLMDGLMPKLHGFVACKAIKQLHDPPKVLMLTGIYTKLTYRWQVRDEYYADGLVTKPFDKASLLDSIETLLSELECERQSELVSPCPESVFSREILSPELEKKRFAIAQPHLAHRPASSDPR